MKDARRADLRARRHVGEKLIMDGQVICTLVIPCLFRGLAKSIKISMFVQFPVLFCLLEVLAFFKKRVKNYTPQLATKMTMLLCGLSKLRSKQIKWI